MRFAVVAWVIIAVLALIGEVLCIVKAVRCRKIRNIIVRKFYQMVFNTKFVASFDYKVIIFTSVALYPLQDDLAQCEGFERLTDPVFYFNKGHVLYKKTRPSPIPCC